MRHGDRVAVRRRLGGNAHAENAGRAAAVVDDNLLAEAGPELVGHDARHRVDAAAGRKRYNHDDRPRRISILRRNALKAGCGQSQYNGGQELSSAYHAASSRRMADMPFRSFGFALEKARNWRSSCG